MILRKPSVYDRFSCIASQCPDSCCKDWSVTVDPESAAFYRSLPGPLGQRLRQVLQEEDGDTILAIEDGRCPMWRHDGLCRIQAELNHDTLCKTCREFPRLTHDYGDRMELGLELSCPEAARLLLTGEEPEHTESVIPGGEAPEYDEDAMAVLLRSRETALSLLSDPRMTVPEALCALLLFGAHTQAELDGEEMPPFDPNAALETARQLATIAQPNVAALMDFYAGLEILTESWSARLASPTQAPQWSEVHRRFAKLSVERYWLQSVSDYDLLCRVKMTVSGCILVYLLGGDPVQTVQQYSKEIDNNADNVEAVLDGAYRSPALTDAQLLSLLLG